ncbi:MAG: hypothetical protein ACOCRB_02020 [Halanaerobiaceae bacterium]
MVRFFKVLVGFNLAWLLGFSLLHIYREIRRRDKRIKWKSGVKTNYDSRNNLYQNYMKHKDLFIRVLIIFNSGILLYGFYIIIFKNFI